MTAQATSTDTFLALLVIAAVVVVVFLAPKAF